MTLTLLSPALACGAVTPELWRLTRESATRYGLEPELLGALVWHESRYCAGAVSPKGAIGLGQLMPATARALAVDAFDPSQNLDGAARYLAEQHQAFGSWALALAAYNAGPGTVTKYQGIPPWSETKNLVSNVLELYETFKRKPPVSLTPPPWDVEPEIRHSLAVFAHRRRAVISSP